jgi:hypothetical protein
MATMKKGVKILVFGVILLAMWMPVSVYADGLTKDQSQSLIAVVQSSPGTPADVFVPLITAFSNISTLQATSLVNVIQAAPGVSPDAFTDLLISFTVTSPKEETLRELATEQQENSWESANAEESGATEILLLTNSYGVTYSFDDPMLNRQRIEDLLGSGFEVTQGVLPAGIVSTTVSTETTEVVETNGSLEIVSFKALSTNRTVTIDWTTNKPTQSRVFLESEAFAKSYESKSESSTRHILNIEDLSPGIAYTYEIEAVSDNEITRATGGFSTMLDIHLFTVQSSRLSCSIKENGSLMCTSTLEVKYETGKDTNSIRRPKGVPVSISIPSLNFNQTVETDDGNYGGDSRIYATFRIPISKDGNYPTTLSANGAVYGYTLSIDTINNWKDKLCKESGAFCNSGDIAYLDMTPRVVKLLDNQKILGSARGQTVGELQLVGFANSTIKRLLGETNIQLAFQAGDSRTVLFPNVTGIPIVFNINNDNTIRVSNEEKLASGTYTFTITDIEAYGVESGSKKVFGGLPVTFTFTAL